jgi:signal transduction histidine kinase
MWPSSTSTSPTTSGVRAFPGQSIDGRAIVLSADPRGIGVPYADRMSIQAVRALWSEPRAPDAEGPQARDWALVAILVVAACAETVLRGDLTWRVPSLAVALLGAWVLPWRRVHPLAATATAVGIASTVQLAALARDVRWEGLGTGVFFLLLPYALGRWGSGREVLGGVGVFAAIITLAAIAGETIGDVVGGAVVVVLLGAVGMGVRYKELSGREKLDSTRSRERLELARELHDTVAHHVSAIAVQAQAGRALARSDGASTADVLEVIEEQASRALEEMRSMVSALRESDQPDLAPQQGVHDIERLARAIGPGPAVTVELSGGVDDLRPSVDAAIYRIAREAITNARRHAQHATRVIVRVENIDTCVRLTVDDDGDECGSGTAPGFGLAGMAERAKLLGGTFSAGPRPDGGWNVTAVLPHQGTSR